MKLFQKNKTDSTLTHENSVYISFAIVDTFIINFVGLKMKLKGMVSTFSDS